MDSISYYQEKIANHFSQIVSNKEPKNLYEPIEYILSLGGKRMRPVLTLMASEVFNVDCEKAIPAATAVEVFHNFSLIHDDIMDDAPLRRGNQINGIPRFIIVGPNGEIVNADAPRPSSANIYETFDGLLK